MKLIRADEESFLFAMGDDEKELLREVLKCFPIVPICHHRLTRSKELPNPAENQLLLEEALAAQRAENQQRLARLLNEPQRFTSVGAGFQFALTREEIEWLLQVLNDVRIGSWLALGAPNLEQEHIAITKKNAPHLWRMELAGGFEMSLLNALSDA